MSIRGKEPDDWQRVELAALGPCAAIGEKLRPLLVSDECSDRRVL